MLRAGIRSYSDKEDRKRVEAVLRSQEFADVVFADEAEAVRLGATGVQFTVFGRRRGVSGASTVAGYAQAIEGAWSES